MAVSQDDELFASYFWWRKFYRARPCNSRHGMEIACHTYTFTQVWRVLKSRLLPSQQVTLESRKGTGWGVIEYRVKTFSGNNEKSTLESRKPLSLSYAMIFQAYCELCAKLHQDPPERNILTDIHSWWTKSQCNTIN